MPADQIQYSEKYFDDKFEYRHVILPADLAKHVPKSHLMTETEWRNLGVQQSPGWVHYMMHAPEPHVILFRRKRVDEDKETSILPATTTSSANNVNVCA
ncbi:cyclin-dependent kinases regulatory subunit [Drosophila innubila]|uniref:cyclin-dependent kinases regulatory subunit n=1 Tax=Drosophila innubila TaxID=198719 RepID=UPI00148C9527|nr:cyclin-dependent kinases regulatory subunit [Drosophila innubila]